MIKRIFNRIFKKKDSMCYICGKNAKRGIEYCGVPVCSEECFATFFKTMTTDEIIESHEKDMNIRREI